MPASMNQMVYGANVISNCVSFKLISKRFLFRHHVLALVLSLMGHGFILQAFWLLREEDGIYTYSALIWGSVINFLSCVLQGLSLNFEEWFLRKHVIDERRMIGLQGMFGIIWTTLFFGILSYVRCRSPLICAGSNLVSDPIMGFRKLMASNSLIISTTILMSCVILNQIYR